MYCILKKEQQLMDVKFEHLDPLLLDLKILSEVGQHEKIQTKSSEITVTPDSFMLAFIRFLSRESRHSNLARITDLLTKTAREIDEFTSGRRHSAVILERIKLHLINARGGIENLAYTYRTDANTKSKLGIQIDKLDDMVATIVNFQQLETVKKQQ